MDHNYNYKVIKRDTRQLTNMETSFTKTITTGFYKFLARFSGEFNFFFFSL